jgi:hypothetical protein
MSCVDYVHPGKEEEKRWKKMYFQLDFRFSSETELDKVRSDCCVEHDLCTDMFERFSQNCIV